MNRQRLFNLELALAVALTLLGIGQAALHVWQWLRH